MEYREFTRSRMSEPIDLLLITWNRCEYVQKTVSHLLASHSDFRLYCWDNASADGCADFIAGLTDDRIVQRHFSKENVMQRAPWLWFYQESTSDLIGKIDDDMLLPAGWIERIAPLLRAEPKFGLLACWVYMPEDWNEAAASHKIIEAGGTRIFQNCWVAGNSFLGRKSHLGHYVTPPNSGYGLPVDQARMSKDGLINGYPLPILFAHNMDDPRSPHCLMNRPGGMGEQAALTARKWGFATPQAYADWIAADAKEILRVPVAEQVRNWFRLTKPSLLERIKRRLLRAVGLS